MKKILVTGAAGTIGLQVIRFLLSEGKYEITATFIGSSNYEDIAPMKATLTILGYNKNPQSIEDSSGKSIVEITPENGVLEIYNIFHTYSIFLSVQSHVSTT